MKKKKKKKKKKLMGRVCFNDKTQVLLPKILDWYSRELMINSATLLEWV
jgi:hypothetical protein